ncbi:MAG: hypothetical protein QOG53_3353 [Frankiales bacterium]|nr:hypothetical protein [Frankiales bacterium]
MDGLGETVGYGRRLAAYVIDTVASVLVALAFTDPPSTAYSTAVFAAFSIEKFLLTALTGASLGQRLTGIEVRALDGTPVGFRRAAIRTFLVLLIIPVVIIDRDGRGLHDRLAGTRLVRSR